MFASLRSFRAPGLIAASAFPGLVFAQAADAAFTSVLTDTMTSVGTYAAALVGLAAVGVVFMVAIKYVKKIRGAA